MIDIGFPIAFSRQHVVVCQFGPIGEIVGYGNRDIGHPCNICFCIGPVSIPRIVDPEQTGIRKVAQNPSRAIGFDVITGIVAGTST